MAQSAAPKGHRLLERCFQRKPLQGAITRPSPTFGFAYRTPTETPLRNRPNPHKILKINEIKIRLFWGTPKSQPFLARMSILFVVAPTGCRRLREILCLSLTKISSYQ